MIREFIKSAINKKNTVMLVTSVCFMLGIASFFTNSELLSASILTVLVILLLKKQIIPFKTLLVFVVVFYLGFFNAYFRVKDFDELVDKAPSNVEMVGRITSIPNSNVSNKARFFFEVESLDNKALKAKTIVNVINFDEDFSKFRVGQVYKISGKLRTPIKATNPSQFDYGKYLRNFDVFTVLYAESSECLALERELPLKWRFLRSLNDFRNDILKVHSQYLKSPNLEILGGIVFGDDAVAPPDYVKDSFINSGLLHILAASGMNVAFIFGFWFYLLSLLRISYKGRVVSGIGVVILYTLMTGLGASVIRAALMLVFVLIGKLINRDSHSIALLSFVAFLMLLYNPAYLNDVGFQLSFVVTFGLLCSASVLSERFNDSKVKSFLAGTFVVPIVAQIWVIPIQMFYFNTISVYSFLANISILPFLSVVSFGGFISSILARIPILGEFICQWVDLLLNFCLECIVSISKFFSILPSSLLETVHPTIFQVLIYYVIVLFLTLIIKSSAERRHYVGLVGLILLLLVSFINISNDKLEIIMFDVGNADSFLVKTPQNKYLLIDTAKQPFSSGKSQAEMIIRKYLKDRGVKDLELLIITHFDSDHAGGAPDIINKMRINNVIVNSLKDKSPLAQNIYSLVELKSGVVNKATDNQIVYEEGDLRIRTFQKKYKSDNESSVIALLSYKDFDVLFTGDAGVKALSRVTNLLMEDIEVLKVGHHGAEGVIDEKCLNSLKPEVSLVSVGKNTYGHPNQNTLSALAGTEIFRTDKVGAVKIIADGKTYSLWKYSTDSKKFEYVLEKVAK